jgi:osmotically-inducible protein OsmY
MTPVLYATDHELKTAVLDELACTSSVQAVAIDVTLSSGAVTLSGEVETYAEKHEAVHAAMRVHGVTAVADDIVVRNGWAPRNDSDIAVEATEALDRIASLPSGSVQVLVHDHVVTLSGAVAWGYQREATRHAVAALRGVNAVVNAITLIPEPAASATDATRKITAALVRTPRPTPTISTSAPAAPCSS